MYGKNSPIKQMKMSKNTKFITTNILQVVANKAKRSAATFVASPKGNYYLYNGDRIKENHFDLMLPVKVKQVKHY